MCRVTVDEKLFAFMNQYTVTLSLFIRFSSGELAEFDNVRKNQTDCFLEHYNYIAQQMVLKKTRYISTRTFFLN